jgi:hypothetical protein
MADGAFGRIQKARFSNPACRGDAAMRATMAAVFALLTLNFADEHFNSARYTRAAMKMLSHIARSFG